MCQHNYEIIRKVFSSPEQVMAKFILNIYQLKIREYIDGKLGAKLDTYAYLKTLFEFYSKLVCNLTPILLKTCKLNFRTNQLSNELLVYNMGIDRNYLNKLTGNIFNKYIDNYIT